ncbi:MAG: hypothetical protein MPL62_17330 [Alphaproteobacteria bacterium]|nr:hypothetical protein [Alphaproteobacteria bacterium]
MVAKNSKRAVLTLKERKSVEKGKSCHEIVKELGVGETQIQGIVKDKVAIKK